MALDSAKRKMWASVIFVTSSRLTTTYIPIIATVFGSDIMSIDIRHTLGHIVTIGTVVICGALFAAPLVMAIVGLVVL